MLIKIDPTGMDKDAARAADCLAQGKVMVYPTETVYGIGCDALNGPAIRRVTGMKGRTVNKPLIVLIKDAAMMEGLVREVPPLAKKLMQAFWPGPLTLIFRTRPGVSPLLTGDTGTIGIRQSPHPFVRSLFGAYAHPIVSTSANVSGGTPALSVHDVPAAVTDQVDLIIDGGKIQGVPSTVVDVSGGGIVYVREGAVKKSSIERLCYDRD